MPGFLQFSFLTAGWYMNVQYRLNSSSAGPIFSHPPPKWLLLFGFIMLFYDTYPFISLGSLEVIIFYPPLSLTPISK